MELQPRKEKTHHVDLFIPVNAKEVMQQDLEKNGKSCFTHLWEPANKLCSMCADKEVCGILFHKRLKSRVAKWEETVPTPLDLADFEGISYSGVLLWLNTKQRSFNELVEYITEKSNCSDEVTVKFWCKSFIKEHSNRVKVEDGVIVVNS